jgi:membrane-associated phospholipid phosphatase
MTINSGLKAESGPSALRQGKAGLDAWLALVRRAPRGPGRIGLSPWSGRVVGGAAVALAMLVLTMVLIDAWAIGQSRALPAAFRSVFNVITEFGKSGWFLWPIGLLLLALALVNPQRIGRIGALVVTALALRLTFLFAAIALPGIFAALLKYLIGRGRPFVGGAADPYLYDLFIWQPAYASFPSGHSTTAFAAALAFGALWPQVRPYIWSYAVLIGVSRVIVTAHHPSDVIAGAVVGVIGAVLVRNWFAARRIAFAVNAEGRVRRLPGPSLPRIKAVARRLWGV